MTLAPWRSNVRACDSRGLSSSMTGTMPKRRKWSPEDDRRLRSLQLAGVSLMKIAKELRRTEAAVAGGVSVLSKRGAASGSL